MLLRYYGSEDNVMMTIYLSPRPQNWPAAVLLPLCQHHCHVNNSGYIDYEVIMKA